MTIEVVFPIALMVMAILTVISFERLKSETNKEFNRVKGDLTTCQYYVDRLTERIFQLENQLHGFIHKSNPR